MLECRCVTLLRLSTRQKNRILNILCEMERMHIMRSNIAIEEYVMCDMCVCVRMNAYFIQTGYPKMCGVCLLSNMICLNLRTDFFPLFENKYPYV